MLTPQKTALLLLQRLVAAILGLSVVLRLSGQALPNQSFGGYTVSVQLQNDPTNPPVANEIACWNGQSASGSTGPQGVAAVCSTSPTYTVPIGIVVGDAGSGYSSIAQSGPAQCSFSSAATAGNYVTQTTGSPYCLASSSYPSGPLIGIVLNGSSGSCPCLANVFVATIVTNPLALTLSTAPTNTTVQSGPVLLSSGLSYGSASTGAVQVSSGTSSSGTTGSVVIKSGGGTSGSTGNLTISTGGTASASATGSITMNTGPNSSTGGTGSIGIDAGGTPTSGAPGSIQVGPTYASGVSLGRSGIVTTNNGTFTSNGLITAENGVSISPTYNLILQPGTGGPGEIGVGTTSTPAAQVDVESTKVSGTLLQLATPSSLSLTGALTGEAVNLVNYSASGQSATGVAISLPGAANTGSGTYSYSGETITGGSVSQSSGSGTDSWNGLTVNMPNISGSAVASTGVQINGGTPTSGAVSYALTASPSAGNVGIGTTSPSGLLSLQGSQPAAVSGAGTNATPVLQITGGQGGNTTAAATAGTGAAVSMEAGQGGNAGSTGTNGAGGSVTISSGAPGTGGMAGTTYGNILLNPNGNGGASGATGPFVGVGTNSPSRPFQVDVNADGVESDFLMQNDNTDTSSNYVGSGILMSRAGSPSAYLQGGMHAASTGTAPGTGVVAIWEGGAYGSGSPAVTDLIVLSGGNVGIGALFSPFETTAGPSTTLQVSGTAGSGAGTGATVRIGNATTSSSTNVGGCLELADSAHNGEIWYFSVTSGVLSSSTTKPSFCQ